MSATGGGTCNGTEERLYLEQTVAIITSQNYQRTEINCVGVLMGARWHRYYMMQLSQASGGTYKEIR